MKLAFFGSDAFAVPSLEALAAAGHEVALVITNPDRRRGRSKTLLPTPVKEVGERLGAAILQPEGRPKRVDAAQLREAGCELGVVVAYGQFLGRRVREAPSRGYSINLHGSLLPRWRGAAPVAAALLAGDAVTGVSVQKVAQVMDAGDVLLSREEPVRPDDTRGGLRERLSRLGAEALVEAVGRIAAGEARFVPQDEAAATYASLLSKEDGRLDPALPAAELERRVRALSPWPTAYLTLDGGERLQVLRADVVAGEGEPGTVLAVDGKAGEGLTVAVGEGALRLLEVKPTGKRAMPAKAYANGRRLAAGQRL